MSLGGHSFPAPWMFMHNSWDETFAWIRTASLADLDTDYPADAEDMDVDAPEDGDSPDDPSAGPSSAPLAAAASASPPSDTSDDEDDAMSEDSAGSLDDPGLSDDEDDLEMMEDAVDSDGDSEMANGLLLANTVVLDELSEEVLGKEELDGDRLSSEQMDIVSEAMGFYGEVPDWVFTDGPGLRAAMRYHE